MTTLELTLSDKIIGYMGNVFNTGRDPGRLSKKVKIILENYFSFNDDLSPVFSNAKEAIAYAKKEVKKYRANA
jgi:hypothetical protein